MSNKRLTIEDVEEEFEKVFLLKDKGVVRLILATVIGNLAGLTDKPIWLLLVAPSSGGKSALLETLGKLKECITVDTLTTNTFASGLKGQEEASLLHKANGGILIFKDFTTLTSMNEDGLKEIMGQMRAIYDGTFDKQTGNNVTVQWTGKLGIIAGGTVAAQRKMRQFSEQGERFVNYFIEQPDRVAMTKMSISNQKGWKAKLDNLQDVVLAYVTDVITNLDPKDLEVPEEVIDEMIRVADFATLARSPVLLNKKTNKVEYVPPAEMPSRVAGNLSTLAHVFMIMSQSRSLVGLSRDTIYKTALDSIPAERLTILRLLAKYMNATTKNLAIKLNYPTDPIRSWCEQLNALGIVDRVARGTMGMDSASDGWKMKKEYRDLMAHFEKITVESESLTVTEEEAEGHVPDSYGDATDDWLMQQARDAEENNAQTTFDTI